MRKLFSAPSLTPLRSLTLIALTGSLSLTSTAQLPAATQASIADAANRILAETGVPSASIGIVQGGRIVYTQAFGYAYVAAKKPATAAMAYPIGSISKQFTAQAALLLQQQGKLSIDDTVSKYFPELTRASEVTLRNLMTMTSGYEDFAPQDYIIPAWYHPIDPLTNVRDWAGKPLDFSPGTDWQYSNTNYVLLGLIVQKVSGQPLGKFIRDNVLAPLHLENTVFNTYTQREKLEVTGYVSNAMAPVRVLPLEAPGWYFADGDLAMPAAALLTWDIGIMKQTLLSPASYKLFETAQPLASGKDSGYGLGTFVRMRNGHRELQHGGEVGGYVAGNCVYPDDGVAIVVLTNEVASSAAGKIITAIRHLILPAADPATAAADAFAATLRSILTGFQTAQIDRTLFTADTNAYFTPETLADFRSTLAPLGAVTTLTRTDTSQRGGMEFGLYKVAFASGTTLLVDVYLKPDGKIEQLLITGKAS